MTNELLEIAKKVKLPKWATHVAVSTVRNEGEACAWVKECDDYVDEDPTDGDGAWVGAYKHQYWKFFSREELSVQ